ncbi:MAG: hypothetical protein J7501_09255 [Bdellovibrio sp.]|nr:hypothetical protein [Bdellovibrio sp.]
MRYLAGFSYILTLSLSMSTHAQILPAPSTTTTAAPTITAPATTAPILPAPAATTTTSSALTTQTSAMDVWVQNMRNSYATAAAAQAEAANTAASRAARNAMIGAGLQVLFTACPYLNAAPSAQKSAMGKDGAKIQKVADDTDAIMDKIADQNEFVYADSIDVGTATLIGRDVKATMAPSCDRFMNEDGKMGGWGQKALSLIKGKPSSFGENIPGDIKQWCPNYPKMSSSQRELFWVWAMMSMASSEASCDAGAKNVNAPNGTAMGLFQLEYNKCPKARDLYNANDNIECAVDLLAKELENRDDLMTPTSKGKEGTYWGPLRSDDWNKKRGGDIKGARKTRAIMVKYRYCTGEHKPGEGAELPDSTSEETKPAVDEAKDAKSQKAPKKSQKPSQAPKKQEPLIQSI